MSTEPRLDETARALRGMVTRGSSGDPLPAVAYLDSDLFAFERAILFAPAWHFVAHASELALPGTWKRVDVVGESVLIVRCADLTLRAFFNVCRHRGVPLVEQERGRVGAFECPYHGFIYELDGRLRSAARMSAEVECASAALVPVSMQEWNGLLFVSMDGAEASFERTMNAAPPWLTRAPLSELVRVHDDVHEVAANWKVIAENFQESDHFVKVHPALEQRTPTSGARTWEGNNDWLGGFMDVAEGFETVSSSGRRMSRPFVAAPEDRVRVSDAFLFPALLTSLQPDYLLTYRLDPVSFARTRVHFSLHVHRAFSGDCEAAEDLVGWWRQVNREDREICEKQQTGIGSGGYQPLRLVKAEEGLVQFHRLLRAAYAFGEDGV